MLSIATGTYMFTLRIFGMKVCILTLSRQGTMQYRGNNSSWSSSSEADSSIQNSSSLLVAFSVPRKKFKKKSHKLAVRKKVIQVAASNILPY